MELGTGSSVNSGSKCRRSLGPLYCGKKGKDHSVSRIQCAGQDREILMWAFNTGAQVFRVLDGNSHNNHPQATQRLNNEDSAYFLSFGTLTDKCVGKLR